MAFKNFWGGKKNCNTTKKTGFKGIVWNALYSGEEAATLGLRIVGAVRTDRLQRLFSLGCVPTPLSLWCRARSSETIWRGLWWRCSGCAGRRGGESASE